jgi:hypothetical protein
VSLDSVVYAFLRGESSDGIVESFPALSLEQVYGALAFYLGHRDSIDRYLQDGKAEFVRLRDEAPPEAPPIVCEAGCRPRTDSDSQLMRPRFQADADFNHKVIRGLRRRETAIDFQDAHAGRVIGLPEP